MNTTDRILGESEPEFSTHLKDALALVSAVIELHNECADEVDSEDNQVLRPLSHWLARLRIPWQAYEAKYPQEKTLSQAMYDHVGAQVEIADGEEPIDYYNDFWFYLKLGMIKAIGEAIKSGDIEPYSMVDSILSGMALNDAPYFYPEVRVALARATDSDTDLIDSLWEDL
jgi:hypothetical protein